MTAPHTVYGYHGTSREAARSILAEQRFEPSANPYDWLGYGSYFFQESSPLAWEWALRMHNPEPAIVRARIRVADFMDLLDPEWCRMLTGTYNELIKMSKTLPSQQPFVPGDRSGPHPLDRYVIDYAVGALEAHGHRVRAVRGVFLEGKPAYPNSYLFERGHIQIAVRDQSIVEEIVLEAPTGASC